MMKSLLLVPDKQENANSTLLQAEFIYFKNIGLIPHYNPIGFRVAIHGYVHPKTPPA
jgi:hypothetical protein